MTDHENDLDARELDARISAALKARTDALTYADLGPALAPTDPSSASRWRGRWLAPVLAAAAVVAVVAGTTAIVNSQSASSNHLQPGGIAVSTTVQPPIATQPTATPPTATQPTATQPSASPSGAGTYCYFGDFGCLVPFGYLFLHPLWPFASYSQAHAWQVQSARYGSQPWHLDAIQTALLFTQNYLGFRDITTVTSTSVDASGQAHIGVGYVDPSGTKHTSAVLHLVRYSPTPGDTAAGWEVVGSDDTTFSLETPAYGSQVTSPMIVGGHVTGVDENIVVSVRTLSGSVQTAPGVPAGGQHSPWSESVPFTEQGVLTIVAFTGGHLIQHERFAITGVHA